MKRFLSILLLLALLPLCFAACQRTPDEVIVVQKDTERLVEQARAHGGAADAGQALSARLGTPERYRADYAYADAFSMTADAAVVLPEADRLPTARVIPADFSQETVDRLYAYLVGDTPMYQVPSRRTKASIEAELLDWKRIAGDSGASEEQRAQAHERIEALTAQYADAPETAGYEVLTVPYAELCKISKSPKNPYITAFFRRTHFAQYHRISLISGCFENSNYHEKGEKQ